MQAGEAEHLSTHSLPLLTEGCPWEPELSCTLGLCLLEKALVEKKKAAGFEVGSWSQAAAAEESEWARAFKWAQLLLRAQMPEGLSVSCLSVCL